MRFIRAEDAGWPDRRLIQEPVLEDAAWNTAVKYDELPDGRCFKRAILNVKHPVHGWMSLQIPRDDVRRLADNLAWFEQHGVE